MNILITGCTGFIGSALVQYFATTKHRVTRTVRKAHLAENSTVQEYVAELMPNTCWLQALNNIDIVIHTAARVHMMKDNSVDPLSEYRFVNVQGTLNLARQAAEMHVKRFIYISSVKVNGEETFMGKYFFADDVPAPCDPYGVSKKEAEEGLFRLASETGMEVVVIRPPLVYGPGVKANFLSMMRWLNMRVPLPFGAINNHRSMVALDNLISFISVCLEHPGAANQVFLVSDGEDLSTTNLLKRLGTAMNKPPILLPVPHVLLIASAALLGKQSIAIRICGSLQVDINKNKKLLGWIPPIAVQDALQRTAIDFISNHH